MQKGKLLELGTVTQLIQSRFLTISYFNIMMLPRLAFSKTINLLFGERFLASFVLIFFCAISALAGADNKSISDQATTKKENASSYKISFQSGNSVIQNGRSVGKEGIYFQPRFNYYHTCGFYSSLSANYSKGDKKRAFQNAMFNIGYDKDFGDHLSLGVDYTYNHYFNSLAAAAGIPQSIILNASWFSEIITPTVSAIWSIDNSTDYSTSFDVMHTFIIHRIFTNADKLISPAIAGVYVGSSDNTSLGFTSAYLLGGIKYRIGFFSIGSTIYYSVPINQSASTAAKPSIKLNAAFYF